MRENCQKWQNIAYQYCQIIVNTSSDMISCLKHTANKTQCANVGSDHCFVDFHICICNFISSYSCGCLGQKHDIIKDDYLYLESCSEKQGIRSFGYKFLTKPLKQGQKKRRLCWRPSSCWFSISMKLIWKIKILTFSIVVIQLTPH